MKAGLILDCSSVSSTFDLSPNTLQLTDVCVEPLDPETSCGKIQCNRMQSRRFWRQVHVACIQYCSTQQSPKATTRPVAYGRPA